MLGTFSYRALQKRRVRKSDEVNVFNIIFNMGFIQPAVFVLNSFLSFMVSTLFLKAMKLDVVIISVPTGDVGLGALVACKLRRARHIVDYRDEWEDYMISLTSSKMGKSFYSMVKKLTASLYAKCHLVVAVTLNFAESLKSRGVTNVRLVPNGADAETFKPLSIKGKDESFTVFYSGGIGGYYRLDVAVKALKKLVDSGLRNVKMVIVGEGGIEKVLTLALELGISNNIEYKGVINDKAKLARLIAEADVGLIPYDDNPLWKNSLPAKFFEYCACGIPILATVYEDSILAKLIKEYKIGLTVLPLDEEKLAEAIHRIYQNRSFREEAGKRARLLIEEKFDRNKIAEEFLDLVRTLL